MKRGNFIKHLEANNCPLHRHGSRHDIYKNEQTGVPRHGDIDEELCKEICKQLGIPKV